MLRFGTDGVRGVANSELSPELVLALGRAAARVLYGPAGDGNARGRADRFLVGRDTRLSGPLLQAALSAGLASEGVDVVDVGVLPTPAVAFLSSADNLPAAVISASHNPFADNGVKFFSAGGTKLSDEVEERLEVELDALVAAPSAAVGRIMADGSALERYERHVLESLDGRDLKGLRVALDCANGAAYLTAPQIFRAAGAEVVSVLADEPNGTNINDDCGSTNPARLTAAVAGTRADLGLAFDGDADRVIAVDAGGNVVDGDRLLALFATDLAARDLLAGGTVVVTVMTNLGFHQAMAAGGVKVHTVGVGDRYVLEALEANGWALGGEQSGHIVFRSLATTGDGVLSGLLLADLLCRRAQPLDQLAGAALQRFPQVLRNVAVANREGLAEASAVWDEVNRTQALLGETGRVLLRPSGTEPLVRVMVEAPTEEQALAAVGRLVEVLHACLGPATLRH
ncbi:MAG TPA: phosphoglucosamine mutase [Acidimicrobiales bacterium]|nr:phosphoglucosamine mutase [Acidimicrobiales bacterium]